MPALLQKFTDLKVQRDGAENLFEAQDAKVGELTVQLRKERDALEQPLQRMQQQLNTLNLKHASVASEIESTE